MGKRFYHAPSVEAISRERINDIAPLLMSGAGGGGGPAAPSSLYVYVVNSPQFGFEMLGHSGILIQQPSGAVGLYSFHPFNNESANAEGSIAQIVSGGDRSSFGAFRRACVAATSDSSAPGVLVDNGFLRWREPFRRALRLTVPYNMGRSMESFARRAASDPRTTT